MNKSTRGLRLDVVEISVY